MKVRRSLVAEHADEAVERGMMETSNYLEHRYADVEIQHDHGVTR